SAVEAAFLAVGTTGSHQLLPPDYYHTPPPIVATYTATASPAHVENARASQRESELVKSLSNRIREHLSYLREVSCGASSLITQQTAREAAFAWLHCWEATGYALPVPAACTGPDGQMQYAWDRDDDHLELNISPTEGLSFFYRHRQTGELWMEDYTTEGLSPDVVKKLKLFV